jgi:hypothetical protein
MKHPEGLISTRIIVQSVYLIILRIQVAGSGDFGIRTGNLVQLSSIRKKHFNINPSGICIISLENCGQFSERQFFIELIQYLANGLINELPLIE